MSDQPPRHEPYTPTRQLGQAAMQKASDAYAVMRLVQDRMATLEGRVDELRDENADLKARLVAIERRLVPASAPQVSPPRLKRKAA